MKPRAIKSRIMRRYFLRFHNNPLPLCLREWLDSPPVGREFGSPDYERLLRESLCEQNTSDETEDGNGFPRD